MIPEKYRHGLACVMFKTMDAILGDNTTDSCWVLDNFAVTKTVSQSMISETFDDVNPRNWLFFKGGKVEVEHHRPFEIIASWNDYFNFNQHTYILFIIRVL